jgi:S1-C subfamily serine protease
MTDSSALTAFSDALADLVERVGRSTVALPLRRHAASGLVWRDGVLVTAAHVFRHTPATLDVLLAGGRSVTATLVGSDAATDLAVFRIPEGAAPPAEIGDASTVRAGHCVVAVGRGTDDELSASSGIVNRVGGAWQTWLGGRVDRLIRLDGNLHGGLSGGPVAASSGAVIGIASAALSRTAAIVVPSATVSRVVDALLAGGTAARPYLGIGAQPVEGGGLLVTALAAGGPAATAGLIVGDIVVEADGQAVNDLHGLREALLDRVGESVSLALRRGGTAVSLPVTVAPWPSRQRGC